MFRFECVPLGGVNKFWLEDADLQLRGMIQPIQSIPPNIQNVCALSILSRPAAGPV